MWSDGKIADPVAFAVKQPRHFPKTAVLLCKQTDILMKQIADHQMPFPVGKGIASVEGHT